MSLRGWLRRTMPVAGACAASAVLLRLSFPVPGWFPLAWVALVPWLVVLRKGSGRAALWGSAVMGLLAAGLGLSWQFLVTVLGGSLLVVYVGAYFVLFGWLAWVAARRLRVPLVVACPVLWVGVEYLRGFLFTGFPWLFVGHTQRPFLALIQVSDLFGAYAVSFVVVAANAWVAEAAVALRHRPVPWRRLAAGGAFVLALVGATLGYGLWRLGRVRCRQGPRVGIVQGNIPQEIKNLMTWETIADIFQAHVRITHELPPDALDLIVWPETMVQVELNRTDYPAVQMFRQELSRLAARMGAPILVGAHAEVGRDLAVRAAAEGPATAVGEEEIMVGDLPHPLAPVRELRGRRRPPIQAFVQEGDRVSRGQPLAQAGQEPLLRARIAGQVSEVGRAAIVVEGLAHPFPQFVDPAAGERPIRRIHVREGDTVGRGDLLADYQSVVHNSAYLFPPGRPPEPEDRYDKNHLVPFGEYLPLRWLPAFVRTVVPYTKSASPGKRLNLIPLGESRFGVLICYEDAFPYLCRDYIVRPGGGADFLVNISNDGWFRGSHELDQHVAICAFRAVEFRTGIVRSVNSGISAILHPTGRVQEMVRDRRGRAKMIEGTAIGTVFLREEVTFYARHGDLFAMGCLGGAMVVALGGLAPLVAALRRRAGAAGPPHASPSERSPR
ncbi:MAG: apolipoprotein N-acyltransferase [Candidatus Brocadiia bacterium]